MTDEEVMAMGYRHKDETGRWVRDNEGHDAGSPTPPAVTRQRVKLEENARKSAEVCKLPPLTPLVDGLLFLPGESVIYSPPKLGKTFWALDLALSVGAVSASWGATCTKVQLCTSPPRLWRPRRALASVA